MTTSAALTTIGMKSASAMAAIVQSNKAVYTATEVACGWAGAVIKKAIQAIGQEQ